MLPQDDLVIEEFRDYRIALDLADREFASLKRERRLWGSPRRFYQQMAWREARDGSRPAYAVAAEILKAMLAERPYYARFLDRHAPSELDWRFDFHPDGMPRLLTPRSVVEDFEEAAFYIIRATLQEFIKELGVGRMEPWVPA